MCCAYPASTIASPVSIPCFLSGWLSPVLPIVWLRYFFPSFCTILPDSPTQLLRFDGMAHGDFILGGESLPVKVSDLSLRHSREGRSSQRCGRQLPRCYQNTRYLEHPGTPPLTTNHRILLAIGPLGSAQFVPGDNS